MNDEQLFQAAQKLVGIYKLREAVPDIKGRTKAEFITYLITNDRKRLEWLVDEAQTKKRNVFFAHTKVPLNFDNMSSLRVRDESSDLIFEFTKINVMADKTLVSVKAHSEIKEFSNVEEPDELTPISVRFRKWTTITFAYHAKDSIIECWTRSLPKFEDLSTLIRTKFSLPPDTIELIKIKHSDYEKIDEMRYRSLVASGLNIAGATKISIEGDDVQQTLDFLRNEKNLDLEKLCETLCLKKVVTNTKSITFYDNGKISFRPIVKDIYEELRGVLIDHIHKYLEG